MDQAIKQKIDAFFGQYKQLSYKKGQTLIRADDHPAGVFYITSGMVKQLMISQKGDEVVLNIFKPYSFFPMSWAINNTRNIFHFEALSDVTVYKAPKEDAVTFIKNNPDVLFDLMSRVYKGTDGLLIRMAYLMSGSAYSRLVTELLIHSQRFGAENDNGHIQLTITETELAMQAGMSRETVSREMKVLKEKGLVEVNKNAIVLLNHKKLEEELSTGF